MHQNKQTDGKYILSSLDNALCILNLFVPHSELSTAEISELSGINKSTVFRFLVTLENRGFLIRNEKNKYQLGLKFYSFGQLVYTRMELIFHHSIHILSNLPKKPEKHPICVFWKMVIILFSWIRHWEH